MSSYISIVLVSCLIWQILIQILLPVHLVPSSLLLIENFLSCPTAIISCILFRQTPPANAVSIPSPVPATSAVFDFFYIAAVSLSFNRSNAGSHAVLSRAPSSLLITPSLNCIFIDSLTSLVLYEGKQDCSVIHKYQMSHGPTIMDQCRFVILPQLQKFLMSLPVHDNSPTSLPYIG